MHTMSPTDLSILLAEPSDVQRKIIVKHLKDEEVQHITEAGSLADAQAAIAEHEQVLSAIQARDPQAARAAMRKHLRQAHKRYSASWRHTPAR